MGYKFEFNRSVYQNKNLINAVEWAATFYNVYPSRMWTKNMILFFVFSEKLDAYKLLKMSNPMKNVKAWKEIERNIPIGGKGVFVSYNFRSLRGKKNITNAVPIDIDDENQANNSDFVKTSLSWFKANASTPMHETIFCTNVLRQRYDKEKERFWHEGFKPKVATYGLYYVTEANRNRCIKEITFGLESKIIDQHKNELKLKIDEVKMNFCILATISKNEHGSLVHNFESEFMSKSPADFFKSGKYEKQFKEMTKHIRK